MVQLLRDIADSYHDVMITKRDPRVDGWLFMDSPWPTLVICLSYIYVVKFLGPSFMKNRQPLELRRLLILYNFAQVIFSAWMFYEYGMGGWFRGYSFSCQPVDYSLNETAIRMTRACWWYFFSKFTEFLDTIFFVLRKKFQHVSALHVIHHGCMPMSVWFGVKFTPGGHSTFFGLINTFVHIIMYFYYMMAAMGPQYQKYLWWKKYLTNLQMIQFVMIVIHAFQLLFIECNYPRAFVWWIGGHAIMFFLLFADYYIKAYLKKPWQQAGAKSRTANGKIANGKIANGKISNGKIANGKISNGKIANGKVADRKIANGEVIRRGVPTVKVNGVDSQTTNGYVNGHINNGDVSKESLGKQGHYTCSRGKFSSGDVTTKED